jgi:hypothetical protein
MFRIDLNNFLGSLFADFNTLTDTSSSGLHAAIVTATRACIWPVNESLNQSLPNYM